ncbi:hypothetical protein [Undibacterium sp. TJN19]|uniref:hypothetical protein n=1 Tax=Undibacterium sp. TJN19 TaxID=3413055 RepID=UPI003BF307D0
MESRYRKTLKYFALALCVLCAVGISFYFYLLPNMLDPQGKSSSSCMHDKLPQVANGSGLIASAHYTVCDTSSSDSAVYVYVHKSTEPESKEFLVFRYFDKSSAAPPEINWLNKSILQISVAEVDQVTKMLNNLEDVKIVYHIGKENRSFESWRQDKKKMKIISGLAFIFLCFLIFGLIKIVRSLQRPRIPD